MSRIVLLSCLVAVGVSVAPFAKASAPRKAAQGTSCWSGYSYAGVQSPSRGYGVSATLTESTPSVVSNGHVAAWVGIGGAGVGPGGSDEWVQAGIARDSGGNDTLYYEFKQPGDAQATYVPLQPASPGVPYSIVVYERAAQRDFWRVMVNGVKVSDPISLPGSHNRYQPVATAENWDGGVAGSCNAYAFDFSNLAVRAQFGGAWQAFDLSRVLRDPAYSLAMRASGFTAASR
jgi:hypothetical protein